MNPKIGAIVDGLKKMRELFRLYGNERSVGEFVTDLLADIRHFCDAEHLDYGKQDRLAYDHYLEERHSGQRVTQTQNPMKRKNRCTHEETIQLNLAIPLNAWTDDTEKNDASHLLGTVLINGVHFHIDAIEVEPGEHGVLKAVNPDYEIELEGFYSLSAQEGSFRTVPMFGREYVIGITPAR